MKKKKYKPEEIPVTFQSEGNNIVGMHHMVETEKIVIFCHGFTGDKAENKRLFVETARDCSRHGYNVLRFDFYGSGDSAGEFKETTVSHNRANLKDAIRWAAENEYSSIAVLGISLGAATAILTVGNEPVDALVTWSAVPDMKKLITQHAGISLDQSSQKDVYEYDGWEISRDFGVDALQYDIQGVLAGLAMPKFIVQGTNDAALFVKGFHEFRDIVMPPADFMEIPDAGHTYQTPRHRHQLIRQTVIWLNRHF